MAIVRWEPLRELSTLQNEMNRLFGTVFDAPATGQGGTLRRWMPAMDLVETDDHFVLRADLPGLGEEDVNIEVEDRVLTVSGERKAEHEASKEGYHRVERAFGSFSRSLTLPEGVDADAVTARFDRGVLEVRIPKPEQRKPRKISIGVATRRRRSNRSRRSDQLGAAANLAAPCSPSAPRDPGSYARTGTLRLAHGEVRTPAFVPLATKAVVKTLEVREAGALGFDMVLGNTFHLFLSPGHELIERLGGLHRFQRWDRPIITDSGGFQVFSMGHGTVADEIKGRAAQFVGERAGAILAIEEDGVRFRSYLDGSTKFMGPGDVDGRAGRARARTSRSCSTSARRSTPTATTRRARPSARTAGSTAASRGTRSTGPRARSSTGSCRAGPRRTCGARRRRRSPRATSPGSRSAARSARTRRRCSRSSSGRSQELDEARPRHLLGIGEVDDLVRGVELGIDTFDCAMPTRIGRHGMAIVPDPEHRWRVDLAKARWKESPEPLLDGCPCPACAEGYTRAYLHYLLRAKEQTAMRLLTIHNLAYLQRLMAELRAAIDAGRLPQAAAAVRAGAAPWDLAEPKGARPL